MFLRGHRELGAQRWGCVSNGTAWRERLIAQKGEGHGYRVQNRL